MRKLVMILLAGSLGWVTSCTKALKMDPLSFNVTTSSQTFKVGDTIQFNFKGDPNLITFYSGETGHDYEFRDRTVADGKPELEFTSYAQYGLQQNTLQLMVSQDFDGMYTEADINKATWTDITDKAILSTGTADTPSGAIDLSDYTSQGKSFYFAFKYTGAAGSTQKTWTIENFLISLLLQDGSTSTVANIANAGWDAVSITNDAAVWKISATQLRMQGGNATAGDNEDWVITTALNPNKVNPDRGVAIKNFSEDVPSYQAVYDAPGTYKVVFVATNATSDEERTVVRELDLTIQ